MERLFLVNNIIYLQLLISVIMQISEVYGFDHDR